MGAMMKVSRWGNSLAVRLPVDLVRELGINEGDLLDSDSLALRIARAKMTREQALATMRNAKWQLPPDYKFDREEANSRD